jgi:preprotein translocase subunit SecD
VAASPQVKRARKSLGWLAVFVGALIALIGFGVSTGGASWVPKLALDLEGGTQIILTAKVNEGETVTEEQLDQAVSIIRQRVDATGVAEAEITTQGGQNVVVSLPGNPDEATVKRIEASAKLEFRPVLYVAAATTTIGDQEQPVIPPMEELVPEPVPETPGDQAWITPEMMAAFEQFTCDSDLAQEAGSQPVALPLFTCDAALSTKYILGPVELSGDVIVDASANPETTSTGATTGGWAVQIEMNSAGTRTFGEISTRMFGAPEPLNQFAFVLDGKVLSAPAMQAQILDGRPSITGGFTEESAKALADQLKFGALPIGFTVQSQETISATLGSTQLAGGLLAGVIGLVLVVVYSLVQYRLLGMVTVASLVVAALITYLLLAYFSWRQGYRLSLAGVAGIIVAIGITADSFIVYFERVRDELRDGRMLDNAVEAAWKRAFRTILASDGINFLGAMILFIFAIGSVRGFAFTLALTTLVDIIVIALFTHPMLVLLAKTKLYAQGHPISGLDPRQLGAVYKGRAKFERPTDLTKKALKSSKEASRRQTIAERKAAEAQTVGKASKS